MKNGYVQFRVFVPFEAEQALAEGLNVDGFPLRFAGSAMALCAPYVQTNIIECAVLDVIDHECIGSDKITDPKNIVRRYGGQGAKMVDEVVTIGHQTVGAEGAYPAGLKDTFGFVTAVAGEESVIRKITEDVSATGKVDVFTARYPVSEDLGGRADSLMVLLRGEHVDRTGSVEATLYDMLDSIAKGRFAFSVEVPLL